VHTASDRELLVRFEWDSAKARENVRKHGVTFMEAARAFLDPFAVQAQEHRCSAIMWAVLASDRVAAVSSRRRLSPRDAG
jgi:uncharacterized DUF497 family protein